MTVGELYDILLDYLLKGYSNRNVVIDELYTRNFGYPIESIDDGNGEDDDIHISYHL